MRISDWSSDVCSSDLVGFGDHGAVQVEIDGAHRHGARQIADQLAGHALEGVVGDVAAGPAMRPDQRDEFMPIGHDIGRASCRERVCQYVSISVVAVSLKTKKTKTYIQNIKTKK